MFKKIFCIVFVVVFAVSVFSLNAFALDGAPVVKNEVFYSYTSDYRTYGFDVDQYGHHINETEIPNAVEYTENGLNSVFGKYSHFRGYKITSNSNTPFSLEVDKKYLLKGNISLVLQPDHVYLPQQFVFMLGIGSDIIKTYNSDTIYQVLDNGVVVINLYETFVASSSNSIDELTLYFYFYSVNETSQDFRLSIGEFSVVPTVATSLRDVRFDSLTQAFWGVNDTMENAPFIQKTYSNGTQFIFGESKNKNHFSVVSAPRNNPILSGGIPYFIQGTVTVRLPSIYVGSEPVLMLPQSIVVSIGEAWQIAVDYSYIRKNINEHNELIFSFNSVGALSMLSDGNVSFGFDVTYDDYLVTFPDGLTGQNFEIFVSTFSFESSKTVNSQYINYNQTLDQNRLLFDSESKNLLGFGTESLNTVSLLSAPMVLFGYCLDRIMAIPFFKLIIQLGLFLGLSSILLGIVPNIVSRVSHSSNKK